MVKLSFPDTSGYELGNAMRVCVQLPYESLTGMYASLLDDGAAKVKVESRIEIESLVEIQAFSEPSLPGLSWGFCS